MSIPGLSLGRLLPVSWTLASGGAQFANLSAALLLGESDVIDTTQRMQSFGSLGAVGTAFGTSSPEYLAAVPFFGQSPQPQSLLIGKWAHTATAGRLVGGQLTTTQQVLATFQAVTTGSLKLSVDAGAVTQITGLNFSTASNLNAVASAINTALATATIGATVAWNGTNFIMKSATTGATSAVTMPVATTSGVNIASLMGWTTALGAYAVAGVAAESALAAVQACDAAPTSFYYLCTDACPDIAPADIEAISAYVQGSANPHIYGFTTSDPNAMSSTSTSDVGYILTQSAPSRTFSQISFQGQFPAMSMIGLACGINWNGNNTTINFMYSAEPGITAETLSLPQANALDAKRYNYCANYASAGAVLEAGTMFGNYYLDEVIGADWLANYIQVNEFNLFTSVKKIPQTDAGNHLLLNNYSASCGQAVTNGYAAAGVWTGPSFGQLSTGDFMPAGFYIYMPPIATQTTAARSARQGVAAQIAIKLAGAVNTADVMLTINR